MKRRRLVIAFILLFAQAVGAYAGVACFECDPAPLGAADSEPCDADSGCCTCCVHLASAALPSPSGLAAQPASRRDDGARTAGLPTPDPREILQVPKTAAL